ncbi:hypothetical protein CK507_15820 [Pseudomonas sp. WN033]|nr:hypothetical protein CK507_15820 [Pseudomonas sp. WN033]
MTEPELRQELADLRVKLDQADEWANGLYMALDDLVQILLKQNPALAIPLADRWRPVADCYAQLERGEVPVDSDGEPKDVGPMQRLEARKILFRTLTAAGALSPDLG